MATSNITVKAAPTPLLSRDEILGRRTGRGFATLPGGGRVAVRGLTRDEVVIMQGMSGVAEADNYMLATGLTSPKMSVADVAEWASNGDAGDLVAVAERIAELSGLKKGADKSVVSQVRGPAGS